MNYNRKRAGKLIKKIGPAKVARYLAWKKKLSAEQKAKYAEYLRRRLAAKKQAEVKQAN